MLNFVHQQVANSVWLPFGIEQVVYSRFKDLFHFKKLPIVVRNNAMKAVSRHPNNQMKLVLKLSKANRTSRFKWLTYFTLFSYCFEYYSQSEILRLPAQTPTFQKAKLINMLVSFPVGHTLKLKKAWKTAIWDVILLTVQSTYNNLHYHVPTSIDSINTLTISSSHPTDLNYN